MKDSDKKLIGSPVKSDNSFTHKARMLQGWYRAFVLKLPQGYGPTKNSKRLLPNMIPFKEGILPQSNFLNKIIYDDVIKRIKRTDIGGTIETFRLFHNMLSSQPMAFNLFSPLAVDLEFASSVFNSIYPELKQVTNMIVEYAPINKDEYIGDRTAFDIFVEYIDISNKKCILGIETKYTEAFSPTEYITERYKELTDLPNSPFNKGADELKKYNQLWRNMLLAYSMKLHPKTTYHNAKILLVYMKEDVQVEEMLPKFLSCLKNQSECFKAMDIREFIDIIGSLKLNSTYKKWVEEFSLRYLRFDIIEGL